MPNPSVVGSRQWLADLMDEVYTQEIQALREAGQREYAHSDDNAFRNFDTTGHETKVSPELVLWIFMKKHLDGILAYINGHESQREDVRGRINDTIVYLFILRGLVERRDHLRAQPIPGDTPH